MKKASAKSKARVVKKAKRVARAAALKRVAGKRVNLLAVVAGPAQTFKSPALSKIAKAKAAKCPTCHAKPGEPCKARGGVKMLTFHRLRFKAIPRPDKAALARDAGKSAPVLHASQGVPTIALDKITIGKRHRKDFSHVPEVAESINERGGLILPIALTPKHKLIDGEVRMRAWKLSRFGKQPIPYHIINIDSVIAGEWDANSRRKDFTPAEAVSIKREVEATFAKLKAEQDRNRPKETRPAPGRKAAKGYSSGKTRDRVAMFTGIKGRTLEKAEAVIEAAERDPERFGDLVEKMNKTRKVDAAFKVMKIRTQTDQLRDAPPTLPPNGPYKRAVIDFPWPHESNDTQESIDARGRSLRPYAAMAIPSCIDFARDKIAPLLDPDECVVGFCATNHHLANGAAHAVMAALGWPCWPNGDGGTTILTWDKVAIGRGQILRDVTEQIVILIRGKPFMDLTGENPPTTLISERRRENSRKPKKLWELFERAFPGERFASFFSQGGEGKLWDGFGDQAQRFAPEGTTADVLELAALEAIAAGKDLDRGAIAGMITAKFAIGRVKPKLTKAGEVQLAKLRAIAAANAEAAKAPDDECGVLEQVEAGFPVDYADAKLMDTLRKGKLIAGKGPIKLTKAGAARLRELKEDRDEKRMLAVLPDDLDQLVLLYGKELAARHDAIIRNSEIEFAIHDRGLELLEMKANGGTEFGSATEKSPAEQLRKRNMAAVGEVPMWGQRGVFALDAHNVPHIVQSSESYNLSVHAVDPKLPFISSTGFRSFVGEGDGPAFGVTVEDQARAYIEEEFSHEDAQPGKSDKRKDRRTLPMPSVVYKLPSADADDREPVKVGKRSAFDGRAGATDIEKVKAAPAGHVISMTLDWSSTNKPGRKPNAKNATSVARCQCGAMFKALNQPAGWKAQDKEIVTHWAKVRAEAPASDGGEAVVESEGGAPGLAAA